MTELGEIPSEWEVVSTEEILVKDKNSIKIGPFGSQLKKEFLTEKGYKVYGQENVFYNNFKLGNRYINEERYNQLKTSNLLAGDLVISMMGTVGKTAIIPQDIEEGIMDSHLIRLRVDENKYDKRLLAQMIRNSELIKKQIKKLSVGGIMEGLSSTIIKQLKFPLINIKEQEKIASILSTVDEQIDNVDALIEKNKELKKGLMQTLLTKGIGHTKFKKTEIGEIPSEWDIKSIDEITKEVYRYPTYYGIEYVEEGIAEIRGELLNDDASIKKESFRYISEKTAKKFPRTKLEVGDIVISVRGTIGKVGYITEELAGSNITANLLRVSMNRNIMNEHFIKQLFLSDIMKRKFDEITTATTIKTFKVPEFKQIILAIPTKDEQDKIASILLEVDKKIEEHENKKQKLENLKKGLMQQLLTGKIRTI